MSPVIRTLYISYDGALDPLGRTQIVPYLLGLARSGVSPTLITFEKRERLADVESRSALESQLREANIVWRPLLYHRWPRAPATLWDMAQGCRMIAAEGRRTGAQIVHCRGDVAMLMARSTSLPAGTRLLYDVRGFFADERVESGSWERGGWLDRVVRRAEAGNLARADALVMLTRAGLPLIESRRSPLPPHRIIPTCTDLEAFRPRRADERPTYGFAYPGSLGTWYMTSEMIAFARLAARQSGTRALFLTPQADEARRAGVEESWADVVSASPQDVPGWLRRSRTVFFFIRPTFAKKASCPTKLGEALATGLPVLTNPGIGDVDEVLRGERVGVLVDGFNAASYGSALAALNSLLVEPDLAERCRAAARKHFDLEAGVTSYRRLYEILTGTI